MDEKKMREILGAREKQIEEAPSMDWQNIKWSEWVPLYSDNFIYKKYISTKPGFYRVRSSLCDGLVYIGQTGRSLRERTMTLRNHSGRNANNPPWNDPHTAAPALWAFRIENGFDYEVSVACAENISYAQRQCTEDYLLFQHRFHFNASTLANHGRFHPNWIRPSNKKEGRMMEKSLSNASYDSIPKVEQIGNFNSKNWLGLNWIQPIKLANYNAPTELGVYRIFSEFEMEYCGESKNLRSRINFHKRNPAFSDCYVSIHTMSDCKQHHLKEREVDLIGAYTAENGIGPKHQYKKKK